MAQSDSAASAQAFDDEIIEIFVEEAAEVGDELSVALGEWQTRLQDKDVIQDLRRAFHTLKGSGRMVKANAVGDLAWSIENMLNRVTEGMISSTEDAYKIVSMAKDLVPGLVDRYQQGNYEQIPEALEVIEYADVYSRGETVNFGAAAPAETAAGSDDGAELTSLSSEAVNDLDQRLWAQEAKLTDLSNQLESFQSKSDGHDAELAELTGVIKQLEASLSDIGKGFASASEVADQGAQIEGIIKAGQETTFYLKSVGDKLQADVEAGQSQFKSRINAELDAKLENINKICDGIDTKSGNKLPALLFGAVLAGGILGAFLSKLV